MNKILIILLTLSFSLFSNEVTGELLIEIEENPTRTLAKKLSNSNELDNIAKKYGGSFKNVIDRTSANKKVLSKTISGTSTREYKIIKLTGLKSSDINKTKEELLKIDGVKTVEPNYIYKTHEINIDANPSVSQQWYLDAINVKDGWNLLDDVEKSKLQDIVVAVLDSGVDYNHEDLKDAMWVNSGEIAGNNIDDDNNGYIDDIYGANVMYSDNTGEMYAQWSDSMDEHGHGTHVAGIIAASNNDKGIVGIAPGVKIMAVKCARGDGTLTTESIIKAIYYAIDKNANILNMSFGSKSESILMKNALADASVYTVLIASAGNDGNLADSSQRNYPAAYTFVLGVEAANNDGSLASFSGKDLTLYTKWEYETRMPGVNIYSTLPGGNYAAWNGTSMAAPIASGVAALILAKQWDNKMVYTNKMVQAQTAKYANNVVDALTKLPKPQLNIMESIIVDKTGDDDGLADAGESVKLGLYIKNSGGKAKDITIEVIPNNGNVGVQDDAFVTINDSDTITINEIGSNSIGHNSLTMDEYGNVADVLNPINLNIDNLAPNLHRTVFTVNISYKNALDDSDITLYTLTKQISFDLQNGIEVGGIISEDTTWKAFSRIILIDSILVDENVTLTIEEGVEIRHNKNADTFFIKGKVFANGTKNHKIYFKSNTDGLGKLVLNVAKEKYGTDELYDESEKSIFNFTVLEGSISSDKRGIDRYIFNNSIIYDMKPSWFLGEFNNVIINRYGGSEPEFYLSLKNNLLINHMENFSKNSINFLGEHTFNSTIVINTPSNINSDIGLVRLSSLCSYKTKIPNLFFTGNRSKVKDFLHERTDSLSRSSELIYLGETNEEILSNTMQIAPSTTPAFADKIQWYKQDGNSTNTLEVGSTYKLKITFNTDMDTTKAPIVTFGSSDPYTDKTLDGDWIDTNTTNNTAKIWEATYEVNRHSGTGINNIRVSNAIDWFMNWPAPIAEHYTFNIISTGAQAMILQAVSSNGGVDISWIQDDYEFVGGYNVYRGDSLNDFNSSSLNLTKINSSPILATTFSDSSVTMGQTYYYGFQAILSDGGLSEMSNVADVTVYDSVAPNISHTAVTISDLATAININATITDDTGVKNVYIFYRTKGGGAYIQDYMTKSLSQPTKYSYTIGASNVIEAGVEYYIQAVDDNDNSGTTTAYTVVINGYENVNTTISLPLINGWNLISATINLNTLPNTVSVIWQYKDGKWSAYSPNITTQNTIHNSTSIDTLSTVSVQNGTWVLSDSIQNLTVEDATSIIQNYNAGWNLSGTSDDISASAIQCNNSNLSSIWKFSNNNWQLYTSSVNNSGFTSFDSIMANEGFWVNCK